MDNVNSHEIGFKLINCNSSATVHVKCIGVAKLIAMVVVSVFIYYLVIRAIRRCVNVYDTSISVAYGHTCM